MKRILLIFALMAVMLPALSQRVQIGQLYYNLDSSKKTAEVTYYSDYNNNNYVSGEVIIPDNINYNGTSYSVTSIGTYAFWDCSRLTSVTIPNSVTFIGANAFYWSTGLTSVEIPNSVTSIGDEAFYACSSLTSVKIPSSVTSIGVEAFRGCDSLTSVVIGNSVTSIGSWAFAYCSELTSVEIPKSVSSIGDIPFGGCSSLINILVDINNPSYSSQEGILYNKNMDTLICCPGGKTGDFTIPSTVTEIGDGAFFYCGGLTSVTIPNSVTSIGNSAFSGCWRLTSVEIPNSITSIGNSAFSGCTGLTSVEFNAENCQTCGSSSYPAFPSNITDLKIGEKVKVIPNNAFRGCTGLTSVEIPSSVTSIGDYAFRGCTGLTGVTIGNSVTSIGIYAFYNCTGMTSVTIPNSVISIGNSAFRSCTGLTSVEIPNSVTSIGDEAFSYCSGLTSVEIPNSVTSIGNSAFEGCSRLTSVNASDLESWCKIDFGNATANPNYYAKNLYLNNEIITSLSIPATIKQINSYAFYNCTDLTRVEIPSSVTSIGDSAFEGCVGLTSVTIGNSVTSIGNSAFNSCTGLTSVTIPNSVTSIGNSAFEGCASLTSVNASDLESWCKIYFGNATANPNYYAKNLYLNNEIITSLSIPATNKRINNYAFYNCTDLTRVEIPSSVTSIGDSAFEGCNLTQIALENETPPSYYSPFSQYAQWATLTLPDNADIKAYLLSNWRNFMTIDQANGDKIFFASDDVFEYRFIESSGEAFLVPSPHYSKMVSASIPDRVVANRNGEESFYKVTGIAPAAFMDCSNLTQIKLPANCEAIGEGAFYGCTGLTSIEIPNSVIYMGMSAFYNCTGLTSVTIGNSVTSIEDYAFQNCTGLTRVTIPNSVNSIGYRAFYGCSNLTRVTIGNSVTSIGSYAFYNCTGLTSVEIPNSVTYMGMSAFYNCTGLTSVTIGNSVTSIGSQAFHNCSGLTSVEIPNSVIYIGGSAFSECSSLTSVTIPNSVTSIGSQAFHNCISLTSVEIPNSVTSIGSGAFDNCSSLTSVAIPCSVNSIGQNAFANITFDNFVLENGIEILSWSIPNNINARNLYNGRNAEEQISYEGIENLEIGGFVESIPSNCFINNPLSSVIINPGSGIVIEDGAFKGCSTLVEITLPEDIAEIGTDAFSGTALKNITIPNGTIGANAFANCNLDNITIGAGVESIGEKAFDGSNAIKNVYATPTTPPAAENNTFSYYEAQLYVPEEAIDTYYNNTRCWYRFRGKPLVMPESLEVSGPTVIKGESGETFQLSATITPANVTLDRVLWHSTNPAIATVDNNGVVTINNFLPTDNMMARSEYTEGVCDIIASTLYEDSPVAVVRIEALSTSIDYINSDNFESGWQNGAVSNDIYTLHGVCLKRNATQSDIDALAPGMYIIGGRKVIVKN